MIWSHDRVTLIIVGRGSCCKMYRFMMIGCPGGKLNKSLISLDRSLRRTKQVVASWAVVLHLDPSFKSYRKSHTLYHYEEKSQMC